MQDVLHGRCMTVTPPFWTTKRDRCICCQALLHRKVAHPCKGFPHVLVAMVVAPDHNINLEHLHSDWQASISYTCSGTKICALHSEWSVGFHQTFLSKYVGSYNIPMFSPTAILMQCTCYGLHASPLKIFVIFSFHLLPTGLLPLGICGSTQKLSVKWHNLMHKAPQLRRMVKVTPLMTFVM